MRKLFLILAISCVSLMMTAQTNYSPVILSVDIPYPNSGSVIHRSVQQTIGAWNDTEIIIRLVRKEWMDDQAPHSIQSIDFHQKMDSTYTHYRDNGNPITNTGRWFVEVTVDKPSGADWILWQELGRSVYFTYWDTSQQYFIKP